MVNQEIAEIFENIANYLEMQDSPNPFRIRAFKKAAEILNNYPQDISKYNIEQLKALPGIGESLAQDILEYIKTGKMSYYEELKKNSPVKLEELIKIQGIGPKTVKKLYYELGVKTVEDLKKVAEEGKIAKLEGFGPRSEQKILESLNFAILNKQRTRLDIALFTAEAYLKYLKDNLDFSHLEYAGSLRRKNETVGDIDILGCYKDAVKAIEVFCSYPKVEKILGQGDTKASVWLKEKIQVDFRVVPAESFGSALQYFTGSKDHNVHLRKIAVKKGLKLSEYGLFDKKTNKKIVGEKEKDIYVKLVNNYIEPELREDEGEIELALQNKLPKLITLEDIKGDLQMHTTFSDGANTIDEMVQACIKKGYKFMGITDHLGKLAVANAVEEREFSEYLDALNEAKEKYRDKITLFASGEVNIKPDGSLDFKESLLEKLDYVLASVHSSFQMDRETATKRFLTAVENPLVDIIGHPTARLIGKRKGLEFDAEKVFLSAVENNVAFEINAHPIRLDLPYNLARLAKDIGVKLSINTDAHSILDLDLMRFGVYTARKAGVEKENLYTL